MCSRRISNAWIATHPVTTMGRPFLRIAGTAITENRSRRLNVKIVMFRLKEWSREKEALA
jgi:hypothetical protein